MLSNTGQVSLHSYYLVTNSKFTASGTSAYPAHSFASVWEFRNFRSEQETSNERRHYASTSYCMLSNHHHAPFSQSIHVKFRWDAGYVNPDRQTDNVTVEFNCTEKAKILSWLFLLRTWKRLVWKLLVGIWTKLVKKAMKTTRRSRWIYNRCCSSFLFACRFIDRANIQPSWMNSCGQQKKLFDGVKIAIFLHTGYSS